MKAPLPVGVRPGITCLLRRSARWLVWGGALVASATSCRANSPASLPASAPPSGQAGPLDAGTARRADPYCAAPADPTGPDNSTPSTRAMHERLDRTAVDLARLSPAMAGNAAWGPGRPEAIDEARRRMSSAQNPVERLRMHHQVGLQMLMQGRNEEALAEMESLPAEVSQLEGALPPTDFMNFAGGAQGAIGLCALRQGEQDNCLGLHTAESCLFPVAGKGVHQRQNGARRAAEAFARQLEITPNALDARWLLNLSYMTFGEYPDGVPERWRIPPRTFASEADPGRFHDAAIRAGLDVRQLAGGCAIEDFDGDGLLEVAVSSYLPGAPLRLLKNGGDGRYRDVAWQAGLHPVTGGINLVQTDYDNDGRPDLMVIRGGWMREAGRYPSSLLRNRGDGTFEDVTEAAGLGTAAPSHSAMWADYDGDGRLDLFVAREEWNPAFPHPSELFHANSDGTFSECSADYGIADLGWVKSAVWGDYDNDGRPDLYVSSQGRLNRLYHNEGAGPAPASSVASTSRPPCPPWRFRDVTAQAGVGEPRMSFVSWFFDYDNDGWLDLFVAPFDNSPVDAIAAMTLGLPHPPVEVPRLYHNRRDGTFRDVTRELHLDRVGDVMGANFGDIDGDGFLDLYLATGSPDLRNLIPNRMFRNDGGKRFQDVTTAGGFGHLQKGHGVCFGDLDGDGDEEVMAVMGGWYASDIYHVALFENPGHGARHLVLKLEGTRANRAAIGARIAVTVDTRRGPRTIHRMVGTGSSFGGSTMQEEIGLGDATAIRAVVVRWPGSGAEQSFHGLSLDSRYRLREGNPEAVAAPVPRFTLGGAAAK